MKKGFFVAVIAVAAFGASASTYTWGRPLENSKDVSVKAPDQAYVFFLGAHWHDVAYDGSFNLESATLTSRSDGTVFTPGVSGVPSHFSDDAEVNPYRSAEVLFSAGEVEGQVFFYLHDPHGETGGYSPLNAQWFAIVLASDATPGYYGVEVVQITGVDHCEAVVEDFGTDGDMPPPVDMAEFESDEPMRVPEPATGLLALVGIAFLFRRQRN